MYKPILPLIPALFMTVSAFADCGACDPNFLKLPPTVSTVATATGLPTYVSFVFNGVAPGLSLGNGNYEGWCVDKTDFWLPNATYRVFATTGNTSGLPGPYGGFNWNRINYVLNHKAGYGGGDIQNVIWAVLGMLDPLTLSTSAQTLYNAALGQGSNFVPGQNGTVAVLLYFDPVLNDGRPHQSMIVELSCPLTQGYWQNHPTAWPTTSLTVGGVALTQAQLLSIFDMPVKGNAAIELLHQLIAAMLNQAAGAYTAGSVQLAIANANVSLSGMIHVNGSTVTIDKMNAGGDATTWASLLDSFNNGNLTGLCAQ